MIVLRKYKELLLGITYTTYRYSSSIIDSPVD